MGRWARFGRHMGVFVELYIAAASAAFASVLTIMDVLGSASAGKAALVLMPWTLTLLALALLRDRFTDRATASSVKTLEHAMDDNTRALEQAVHDNTAAVRSLTRNEVFPTQTQPYRRLIDHISRHGARHVILFQYSGTKSEDLMAAAMEQGATVELFIEHEDTAKLIGSSKQQERIMQSKGQHLVARCKDNPTATLKAYKAFAPMSVRAAKVDDDVLCLGWYTYEEIEREPDDYGTDKVTISGHDRPTMIVWAGTPEFDVYNDMIMNMSAVYRKSATPLPL